MRTPAWRPLPEAWSAISPTRRGIEVALRHLGDDPPAVGLDAIAGFAAHGTGSIQVVFAGFDRVQYETRRGAGVTRLTKYIGQATRKI